MANKVIVTADLKHRLVVCTMEDYVDGAENEYVLRRAGVYSGWAMIDPKRPSAFAKTGETLKEKGDVPTHEIYMRRRLDINVSTAAWLYEERRISAPRWFKITKLIEYDDFFCFHCRLVERGEEVNPPTNDDAAKPDAGMFSPVAQGAIL